MASVVVWTAQEGADVEVRLCPVVTVARADVVFFDRQQTTSFRPAVVIVIFVTVAV